MKFTIFISINISVYSYLSIISPISVRIYLNSCIIFIKWKSFFSTLTFCLALPCSCCNIPWYI